MSGGGLAAPSFLSVSAAPGRTLRWHGGWLFSSSVRISAGDDLVAELAMPRFSLGRPAHAALAEGRWILDPEGFPRRRIEVRRAEDGEDGPLLGTFHVSFLGRSGRWEPAGGAPLTWRQRGFLPLNFELLDEAGSLLAVFRRRWRGGEVEVRPPGLARRDAGFLAVLGVFVVVWTVRRRARRSN